ncbi:hypothetical protein L195_g059387, partial [Trifolium pratense]
MTQNNKKELGNMESIKRKPRRKVPWWNPLDFFETKKPATTELVPSNEKDDDSDYNFYDVSDSNSDDDEDETPLSSWCYVNDDSARFVKVVKTRKSYAPSVENVNHDHKDDDDNYEDCL